MKLKAALALLLMSVVATAQAQLPEGYELDTVPGVMASSGNVPDIHGVAAVAGEQLYIYGINICINDLQNVCQNKKTQYYNGNNWVPMGQSISGDYVNDQAVTSNGTLYIAGAFSSVLDNGYAAVAGTKGIARWTGTEWQRVGYGAGSYGSIKAVAVVDNGGTNHGVYVGGSFEQMRSAATGAVDALRIAFWNGLYWQALGGGLDGEVVALAYNKKTGLSDFRD